MYCTNSKQVYVKGRGHSYTMQNSAHLGQQERIKLKGQVSQLYIDLLLNDN